MGYSHTNEYLRNVDLGKFYTFKDKKVPAYYDEVMDGASKADIVIFETSIHSTGVGQMLQKMLNLGKRVIALHLPK